ncbi:MAG: hypothetical protein M5R42_04470 [Rhodocyclaceae bacterium]|nr:hypothetical protein [Rhodocyclaceae bacterium]
MRYALCLVLSFVGGLIPASVLSPRRATRARRSRSARCRDSSSSGGQAGPFIGPPLIAMLVAASGPWRDALIVTGSAALLGIVFGLLIRRHERTDLRSPGHS